MGAVAVAPSDPNVVYVGTGNQSGWSFTIGKGIYKSTDAGRTWTNVGLAASQYIGGIVVDPRNANNVLVAALGPRPPGRGAAEPPVETSAERGVYRSTDGGRTWTRVLPADGSAGASDVYLDYGDPQMAFALLTRRRRRARPLAPAPTSRPTAARRGSRSAAAAWRRRAHHRVRRRVGHARPAAVRGRRRRRRPRRRRPRRALYRSDDGGETWTFGTRELASAGGKMYADPQHPDVVYLMGTAIYRSIDGGQHVAAFWGAPSGADPRFLWIDPTNSRRMFAGVDQGPAISVDGGESWTPYYGLVNGQFYRVVDRLRLPVSRLRTAAGFRHRVRVSRSDFGEIRPNDWYPAGGFENGFLIADPLDKRYMYTQGWYHVLRRYDRDTGQVVVLYQPTADDRFGGAPPLAFSPQDPHTLYMAAQHVLASSDRGQTWRTISPDLAAPPARPPDGAAAGGGSVGAPGAGRIDPVAGAVAGHRRRDLGGDQHRA